MEESEELNITCLPVEILNIILQHNNYCDITHFSATCKTLRDVVINNQLLWKNKLRDILPSNMFKSVVKNGNGNWLQALKHFCIVKKQVYDEIKGMSAKYYWQCYDISLEDIRNFFKIALSGNVTYFYVIYILQDLVWKTNVFLDKNRADKPFTMTEMFYAKVALRHLIQTYLAVKWVSSHMKKELPPDIVVNYFLQWTDSYNWHPDEDVIAEINELAARVKALINSQQPEWASFTLEERISKNVLHEKQILAAISQVIFRQKRIVISPSVNLDTLSILQVLKHTCSSVITVAAIYHAVASRCNVNCELVAFPNHLFLEWRDLSDKKNPVVYSIDLSNGELRPKRRCPFSKTDHTTSYKYCPDSLLQFTYSSFHLSMGAIKNWNTQNAFHLLDFLGTSHSQLNPYKNFLPFLIDHTHLPAMNIPLDITNLHPAHIQLIESLANLNPPVKPATKEFVLKRHARQVKYAVGMLCYHKKFDYVGIIRAWDTICNFKFADRMEMELNLHFGMDQPFYYITAADQSSRYVAEENLVEMTRPSRLYHLEESIAREFTHFDGFAYVPNEEKRSEYPDEGPIVSVYRNRSRFRP